MSWAWLTNHHPSVLRHCWLGHVTRKIVSEMTYNVSSGTLNSTIPYQLQKQNVNTSTEWVIILTMIMKCVNTAGWSQWLTALVTFNTKPDLWATSCFQLYLGCLPRLSQMLFQFSADQETQIDHCQLFKKFTLNATCWKGTKLVYLLIFAVLTSN